MKGTDRQSRQSLGCGYEPANEHMRVMPWEPDGRKPARDEYEKGRLRLPVCAGYVCNLPEVIEVARARLHWSKGQLATACEGPPTRQLLDGIEILEMASNELQHWRMTEGAKEK